MSKDNKVGFGKGVNAGTVLGNSGGGGGISNSNVEQLITLMRENNRLTQRLLEKDPASAY